ncbi:MAG: hypothetical protein VX563_00805, partial [Planctomycetota bacterium]|nr:hypothetical protein [Planctomycetota bacterium]
MRAGGQAQPRSDRRGPDDGAGRAWAAGRTCASSSSASSRKFCLTVRLQSARVASSTAGASPSDSLLPPSSVVVTDALSTISLTYRTSTCTVSSTDTKYPTPSGEPVMSATHRAASSLISSFCVEPMSCTSLVNTPESFISFRPVYIFPSDWMSLQLPSTSAGTGSLRSSITRSPVYSPTALDFFSWSEHTSQSSWIASTRSSTPHEPISSTSTSLFTCRAPYASVTSGAIAAPPVDTIPRSIPGPPAAARFVSGRPSRTAPAAP